MDAVPPPAAAQAPGEAPRASLQVAERLGPAGPDFPDWLRTGLAAIQTRLAVVLPRARIEAWELAGTAAALLQGQCGLSPGWVPA